MEILWWLAPAVVVTAVAMVWVSWLGRDGRGEIDRDEAVARLGEALSRDRVRRDARQVRVRERGAGVAVRAPRRPETAPTRASRPEPEPPRAG